MIRVVLADDHAVVRSGLRMLLDVEHDIEVVGEVEDGLDVVAAVDELRPHVLVLDLSLPNRSGQEIVRDLARRPGGPAIVILTMYPEDTLALHLLSAGAAAYLSKSRPPEHVVLAIRRVATGRQFLTSEIKDLANMQVRSQERGPHERLTARESQVFVLLLEGNSVSAIAAELGLSGSTVSNHVSAIKDKLGVDSLPALFRYAHRVGLLGEPG